MARSRAKKAKKKKIEPFSVSFQFYRMYPKGDSAVVPSLYINALLLLFLCDVGPVHGSLVKLGALWACGLSLETLIKHKSKYHMC